MGSAIGNLGFCVSWAVCAQSSQQQWLEVVDTPLKLHKLDDCFIGKKIVHISDIHYSKTVSSKYIKACISTVNNLNPDIVVMTGDFVTCDYNGHYAEKIVGMLGSIKSKLGVFACLGNHDYGYDGFSNRCKKDTYLPMMIERMQDNGVKVLRNEAFGVEIDHKTLCLAGLGDCWADDFQPEKAFSKIGQNQSVIVLAHNPKILPVLKDYNFDAALFGHTHGMRYQLTPQLHWPVLKENDYYAGAYMFCGRNIYVNRGLGRLGRALFNPRPEITVHTLSSN